MNFPAHISEIERHCRTLAAEPGWRDYVQHKAHEMAKEHPAMYGHLLRIVTETINQEKAKCLSSSKK